ncbi:hypothetical protein DICPUDRAFT_74448 [Dictyostelium purpureum]|uniref:Coatomer subunit epsilon n=1 Tax=Dictyostelium purpureum TaxID=5786 RepID=F0Z7S3_DICPU|nr:uncharacterized protein DICPUDRAFT_74448 [Dictyostelium purpureum]EGC39994.1 hypothetical protein DICPUDRAFT_74448 [Dictyostelium purpureum]|eukprot:XP_003283497.1 hypothetical protein DICPUDRAFT_74448 [Dictyostelium purpureum]
MSDDILFDSKNYFYLGNYQSTINEINKKSRQIQDKSLKSEADYYLYRSYIAQGNYELVLTETRGNDHPTVCGLQLLATYLLNPQDNRENAMVTVTQWIADGIVRNNYHLQVIIATVFFNEQLFEDALRILNECDSVEGYAMLIQLYLKIDRLDLAQKAYENMKKIVDPDATPALLALSWINIFNGEEKLKSALSIFEEMSERYGATPLLLNGQAVCALSMRRFEKAESLLLESIDKNQKNADTISNIITCYINMKKPNEIIQRYLNQLKSLQPNHVWTVAVNDAEQLFDQSKSRFN